MIHDVVPEHKIWEPDRLPCTNHPHDVEAVSSRHTKVGNAGFKPLASAMAEALSDLRERDDVRWTYISPAGDFQAEGERTGEYILAGEELTLNDRNESIISYADYAIAMVDEIESGDHIQQRISVVCK